MKSIALALLAVVAVVVAQQVPKVYIRNPGPFTIGKGFSQNFTFSLDEPILCEDAHVYCAVVVLLTNPNTRDITLDTCQVKWTNADWFVPRVVNVKANENFIDDGMKTYTIVTKPVISASEYYNNFDPVDLVLKTQSRPSGSCSATGDPHYTTFDGYYWHEYGPGQNVLYAAPWRDFEIQARVYSRPALHCGLAAREGNDVFYINRCPGENGNVILNFNSPKDKQPIVTLSGIRYTVSFRSGAQLIFDMQSYYMNVYVTAPGMDYGRVIGMCGNWNGQASDDAAAYQVQDHSGLFASQRPTSDLWAWKYDPSKATVTTLPPYASECQYVAPVVSKPVLAQGDSEDITDILKAIKVQATNVPMNQFNFVDQPIDTSVTFAPIDDAAILKACTDAISNSDLGKVCAVAAGINTQTYVDNCVIDLKTMQGDTRFVNDAFNAMQAACAEVAGRDLSTYVVDANGNLIPNPQITKNLCPNGCSSNGVCNNGVCTCDAGFLGNDCSHDSTIPATVTSTIPTSCDAQRPSLCPAQISVYGTNFYKGQQLTCKFGTTTTAATYVSPSQILCTLPANTATRTDIYQQLITVSNDGILFSVETVKFSWFDSICHVCDAKGTCSKNPDSCVISSVCYRSSDISPSNDCMTCKPSVSVSAWSYDYNNAAKCGPAFDEAQYNVNLLDVTKANTPLLQVHAGNILVDADASNPITYSVGPTSNGLLKVDAKTGVVSTVSDINPATINVSTFNGRVVLVATDSHNITATVNLFMTFQGTNRAPVFNQTSYNFTIVENSPLNLVLGALKATDPNVGQADAASFGWDRFTFSWIIQEINFGDAFALNNVTGVITDAKNIDFEAKSVYQLTARALDGGGMFSTADVTIYVVDVNEAPTSVSISSTSIAENNALNAVVGTLTAVDPDAGDNCTFTLRTSGLPFAVQGNKLVVTASLDFEGVKSYSLVIRTSDKAGLFVDTTVVVSVTDVNEAPSAPSISGVVSTAVVDTVNNRITLKEDFPIQTPLALISSQDPDAGQTVTCGIVGASNNFQISGSQLILTALLDFETLPTLTVKIACADTGVPSKTSPITQITVNVADSNESGQNVNLTNDIVVPENAVAGVVVGQVSAIDPDSDASYLNFYTSPSDHFTFDSATPVCVSLSTGGRKCTATLIVRGGMDFETKPLDSCTIITSDNHKLNSSSTIVVKIGDVNEAPIGVDLSSNLVEEGAATGTLVGSVLIIDADSSPSVYTVTLTDSATGRFALKKSARRSSNAAGYDLVVADGSRIDFETSSQLSVSFTVTDNGTPSYTSTFTVAITVTDRAMIPVLSVGSVSQSLDVGRKVGILSLENLDRPDLTPTYALSGSDAQYFSIAFDAITRTANVLLVQSLSKLVLPRNLSLIATVSFQNGTMPSVQAQFSLPINAVNEAPFFGAATPLIYALRDLALGSTLVTVTAQDPENTPLRYAVVSVSPSTGSQFFALDETTGVITRGNATRDSVPLTTYTITISASDGVDKGYTTVTAQVIDNCFARPDGFVPCSNNGVCVDGFLSFTCICNSGFTGNCDEVDVLGPIDLNAAGASASTTGSAVAPSALAGIIVAVIVCVILVAVILLVVVRARNASKATPIASVDSEAQHVVFNEALYAEANVVSTYNSDAGLDNPIYAWYQPKMSRQECEDYLSNQGEGAFVVRDSSFTPGWHMLAVKTANNIVHERIKLNQDGTYQMLPSTNVQQPIFHALPDMVEHYASCKRTGVSFSLAMDNPLYDNHLLREQPHTVRPLETIYEVDAPMVPVRERDLSSA